MKGIKEKRASHVQAKKKYVTVIKIDDIELYGSYILTSAYR